MDGMTVCRWDAHTSSGRVSLLVWLLAGVDRRHKGEEDTGKGSLEGNAGECHWS